jgi:hypothetical protein
VAFTLSRSWDAVAFAPGPARAPLLPARMAEGSRRAGAILLSVLVHLVLIVFLLNRIAAPLEIDVRASPGEGAMTMLDLSDPGSPAPARNPPPVQPAAAAPASSAVDATAPEMPLPAEWTVSRLPPSALASAAPPAGGRASGMGQGAGQSGAGAYDPYAGASPLPLNRESAVPSFAGRVLGFLGFEQDSFALDEAALEAVRLAVARSLPGQAGTAEIVVRVSPTGMVLEADARGGSAAPRAREALARALRGKRLFRGTAATARVMTLPVLRLG